MTLAPKQAYRRPQTETTARRPEYHELPDADPDEAQRRALKALARSLRARLSARELVFLAGAVEVEANTRRAEEDALVGTAEDL